MYWAWLLLFASQPAFAFWAMTGALGEDAEQAAEDFLECAGGYILILMVVGIVVGLAYGAYRTFIFFCH